MVYLENQYTLTVKDAQNSPSAEEIELLINSTFNNLRVEVTPIDENCDDFCNELRDELHSEKRKEILIEKRKLLESLPNEFHQRLQTPPERSKN